MPIGIDELDDFDELNEENEYGYEDNNEYYTNDTITQDNDSEDEYYQSDVDPAIEELLRYRGIDDSSRIKFESDNGELEEVDWNSLSTEDKLGILQSEDVSYNPEVDLDDSEIQLINAIRQNKMTPAEYLNYVQRSGINNYIQNQGNLHMNNYSVDELDDETLYAMDLIAKFGEDNISNDEIEEKLYTAKTNPELFEKEINAIRNEYRQREDENRRYEQNQIQQNQVNQYNRFAESIENEIRNFTSFGGYDISMDEDEMEELYDFITGFDAAGVSIFGKALNNPQLLVKMAWFALNGEEAMNDINNYWTSEIKNVSRSRNIENRNNVEIVKKSSKRSNSIDDLDEF